MTSIFDSPSKEFSGIAMDSAASIEIPRRQRSPSSKFDFVTQYANKLNQKTEFNKTRFANDLMNEITDTSQIESPEAKFRALPEHGTNLLVNDSVNRAAHKLELLQLENKHLKFENSELREENAKLKKDQDQQQGQSYGTKSSVGENFRLLEKKLITYKDRNHKLEQKVQDLTRELEQLRAEKRTGIEGDKAVDQSTESLLDSCKREIFGAQSSPMPSERAVQTQQQKQKQAQTQTQNEAPAEARDDIENLKQYFNELKKELLDAAKASPAPAAPVSASATNSTPKLDMNNMPTSNGLAAATAAATAPASAPVHSAGPISATPGASVASVETLQAILERYNTKKALESQLGELKDDPQLSLIDKIIGGLESAKEKPKSFSDFKRELHETHECHDWCEPKRQPGKVPRQDLKTLRAFRPADDSVSDETWTADISRNDYDLESILGSMKDEYESMLARYNELTQQMVSGTPTENMTSTKRLEKVLKELLTSIGKKREEIYKLNCAIESNGDLTW